MTFPARGQRQGRHGAHLVEGNDPLRRAALLAAHVALEGNAGSGAVLLRLQHELLELGIEAVILRYFEEPRAFGVRGHGVRVAGAGHEYVTRSSVKRFLVQAVCKRRALFPERGSMLAREQCNVKQLGLNPSRYICYIL